MFDTLTTANALIEALADIAKAKASIQAALDALKSDTPLITATRQMAAQRTTGTQILAVLAQAGEPLTLTEIADSVVAVRRGEDEPRKNGGTRYQELCRASLVRLIDRGLAIRVEPTEKRGLMRFTRA